MKQKWLAGFMIAMLMMSMLPMALADEENREGETTADVDVEVGTGTDVHAKGRVQMEERTEATESNGSTDIRENRKNKVEEKRDHLREVRQETRQQIADSREEHRDEVKARTEMRKARLAEIKINAREHYENVKEKLGIDRKDYDQERQELRSKEKAANSCGDDTEQCKSKKKDLKHGVQQHLLKTIELIDLSLEKLMNRVTVSNLTEEEKQDALGQIATLEEKLAAEQSNVEALAENATSEELRTAIKSLKHTWQDVRTQQRRIVASLLRAKMNHLEEKYTSFSTVMQSKIDQLTSLHIDASALVELKVKYEAQLEVVKVAQAAANQAWIEAKEAGNVEGFRTAHEKARQEMKKAQELLREFMASYRNLKQEQSTPAQEQPEAVGEENTPATATADGNAETNVDATASTNTQEAAGADTTTQ